MNAIIRSAAGATLAPVDTILLERRVLYLDEAISIESVNRIIKKMIYLDSQSDKPITLILASPGGSIEAGLALLDTMQACASPVYTITLGLAASMAAIIAAAGEKGHRFISPYSRLMIHEPLLANGVSGSCSTIQATAQSILERKKIIDNLLAEFTGKSIKVIEKATSYDNYLSAQESVDFGLTDKIISGNELMEYLKGVDPNDLG